MFIFILLAPSWEILVSLEFIEGGFQAIGSVVEVVFKATERVNLNVEPSLITKLLIIVSSTLR